MRRNKIEKRNFSPTEETSFRAFEEDGKRYLEGYGSVFNQKSKLIFEHGKFFYEIIDPRAFDEVLNEKKLDIYLTFNHSRDKVIARTTSGTLQLSTDDKGLLFRAELPNVSYALDAYELVKRGDLFENSFAFVVKNGDEEWTRDSDGNNIRIVKRVSKLIDVSIVTSGAYENTTISARNADIKLQRGKKVTITIEDGNEDEEPEIDEEEEVVEETMVDETNEEETPVEETEVEENNEPTNEPIDDEELEEQKALVEEAEKRMKAELELLQMRLKIIKLKS